MSALDELEYGLVVLDKDFQARFINRAFHQMWALPTLSDDATYNFADIVDHGRGDSQRGCGNATSDGRQRRRIVASRGQGYVFGEVRRAQSRFS